MQIYDLNDTSKEKISLKSILHKTDLLSSALKFISNFLF